MSNEPFLLPGHDPRDQARGTQPPVDWHWGRLKTHLVWCSEHLATFRSKRESDLEGAERELEDLEHSLTKAMQHHTRLRELLRAGYTVSDVQLNQPE